MRLRAVARRSLCRFTPRFVDMQGISGARWRAGVVGLGVACGVLNLQPRHAHAQGSHEFREAHLGMEMRFVIVHESEPAAATLARRAFDEVERLEAILSDWRAGSELRRLEHVAPGTWVQVSAELRDVLALALSVARASDGAFDPTVGTLTALWREARTSGAPIDEARRAAALARVGHHLVELDSVRRRVRFARPNMRLDLGAVAKGWILDRALGALAQGGAKAALVEAGGDLAVRGMPPGASGWRVSVPRARGDTVLHLTSGAVSSSGPSAQRLGGSDGQGESHVLDPRSGRGDGRDETVTVTGPSGAIADALSTAIALTAPEGREALARRFGVTIVAP